MRLNKTARITVGSLLLAIGLIFFIIPGTIFLVLIGLTLLSYDVPIARKGLKICQDMMSNSAKKFDNKLLERKLKKEKS